MKQVLMTALCALVILVTSSAAEAANCPSPTTLASLMEASVGAEQAFEDFDRGALLLHSSQARAEILPCLGEPVTLVAAAAFHRLMALEAFTNKNDLRAVAEFHAARRLEPGYTFPKGMVGEEHPLLGLYERAALVGDGAPQVIYPPEDGYVTVDGVRDAPRPSETPVILQVFVAENRIVETLYLQPGDTLPVWGLNVMGITAETLGITRVNLKDPKPWIITGLATLAAGGAMYAVAMDQKSKFLDTSGTDVPGDEETLYGYQDRANGFGTAAIAAGSVGIALTFTGAVLHIRFGGPKKQPEFSPVALEGDHRQ